MTKECTHQVGQYQLLNKSQQPAFAGWQPIHKERTWSETGEFMFSLMQQEALNMAIVDKFEFCPYCGVNINEERRKA